MTIQSPIRIISVDDHAIFGESLGHLLKDQAGIEWLGSAGCCSTAVNLVSKQIVDVVIMDVGMPELDGIETTRQICLARPHTKILALSSFSDSSLVLQM